MGTRTIPTEEPHVHKPTVTATTTRTTLPGVIIREGRVSSQEKGKSTMPSIDQKDKGKGKLAEEVKVKSSRFGVFATREQQLKHDEEIAKRLEERFKAEHEKELREAELKRWLDMKKRKEAEERAAKKRAKPKSTRELRNDLYHKLKCILPLNILKRMSYEQMLKHYNTYQRESAEWNESEKQKELEKKKKAEQEKETKEEEVKEKKRNELDEIENIDRNEEILDSILIIKESIFERGENQNLPNVVDWRVVQLGNSEDIRIERSNGTIIFYKSFSDICRRMSRQDIVDMYRIGSVKYEDKFAISLESIIWEWLRMMFEPAKYTYLFGRRGGVKSWRYFVNTDIHQVIFENSDIIFMLADRNYHLHLGLLKSMIRCKMISAVNNEKAKDLLYFVLNMIHKSEELAKTKK